MPDKSVLGEVVNILKLGSIGLAFLFAYLSYRLITKLPPEEDIKRNKLLVIIFYMVLCIVLGAAIVFLEFNKSNNDPFADFMSDKIAATYFKSGQNADIIEGTWDAVYFQLSAKDGIEPQLDKLQDALDTVVAFKVDSLFTRLPKEVIRIRSKDSGFVLESVGTNTYDQTKFVLWGVGRVSTTKDISFSYWSTQTDEFSGKIGEEIYSGINFLKLIEGSSLQEEKYPYAKGIWMGRNTYGKVVFGLTFWKRKP